MHKKVVLDRGFVELIDVMGTDLTVCRAARVSFNKQSEWDIDEVAKKRLIDSGSTFNTQPLDSFCSSTNYHESKGSNFYPNSII